MTTKPRTDEIHPLSPAMPDRPPMGPTTQPRPIRNPREPGRPFGGAVGADGARSHRGFLPAVLLTVILLAAACTSESAGETAPVSSSTSGPTTTTVVAPAGTTLLPGSATTTAATLREAPAPGDLPDVALVVNPEGAGVYDLATGDLFALAEPPALDIGQDPEEAGEFTSADLAPDQTLYVARRDSTGTRTVEAHSLDGTVTPLATGSAPAVSPTGDRVALSGPDGELVIVDRVTSDTGSLVPVPGAIVESVAWEPGGDRLAVGWFDGIERGVAVVDVSGTTPGSVVDLVRGRDASWMSPDWTGPGRLAVVDQVLIPDAGSVTGWRVDSPSLVLAVDVSTGRTSPLFEMPDGVARIDAGPDGRVLGVLTLAGDLWWAADGEGGLLVEDGWRFFRW